METELKFEVDPATADRLLHELALATEGEEVILKSVYYDTPGAFLRAHGLALRVRDDGGKRIQTVKQTTGNSFRRGEWEHEIHGAAPDMEAAGDSPLPKALGKAAADLKPAFEVSVERARRTMVVDGGEIEVALDRGAVSADGYGSPICELELELKSGSPLALFRMARELAKTAPLDLSFTTKADRGYALIDGAMLSPVKFRKPQVARKDTAEQAFLAIAGACLAQITANARVLRGARRPEAVHQLRVGLRRLRTAVGLFEAMLTDERLAPMKAELKWITGELNDARNLDVFIAETFRPFAAAKPAAPGLSGLAAALLASQTRAYDRAEAALRNPRFGQLTLEIAAWVETGAWRGDDESTRASLRLRPARALAAEVLGKHHHKIVKQGRKLADLDPAARHHLRIRAKKLRYAGDFFASLYDGKAARRLIRLTKALGGFQDGLGALNDIVVGGRLVAELVGAETGEAGKRKADPGPAFAAGQVCAAHDAETPAAIKASHKAWRELAAAEPYW
jgi:triphosphatase